MLDDRARPLVRSRTRQQRRTGATIETVFPRPAEMHVESLR